jgi:hypothetical protein
LNPEAWEDYKRKSKRWAIRVDYELLHSEAFRSLRYAPTLKVLCWSYEKRKIRKTGSRKNRYQEIDDPFSFTFSEAALRGLTHKQFGRAIRELYGRGFLELEKHGSGMHKDFSLYCFSERWRKFGTPEFERKEFPKRAAFGCFGESKRRRKQRHNTAVEQRPISAVENVPQRPKSALEDPVS